MPKQIKDFELNIEFNSEGDVTSAILNGNLNDSENDDLRKNIKKRLTPEELNQLSDKTVSQLGSIISNKIKSDEGIS